MFVAFRTRACLAALVLTSRIAPAQQRSFTIEQALSAPFPDELVAAPAGGALAWVLNAQGVRNIWIATGPDYQGRAVTSYKEDDGQEIGELAWTPDARALVYVRGGDANARGEYPNPLSLTAGAEQSKGVRIFGLALEHKRSLLGGGFERGDYKGQELIDRVLAIFRRGDTDKPAQPAADQDQSEDA